jgi:serine-type D-Ala-D-Ala carboxypeptidase (penicillin-binding protein 5/6)
LLLAVAAAALPRCSPVAQEAQGADAWKPLGGAVGVASGPAASPGPETPGAVGTTSPALTPPRVGAPSVIVANFDTGEILFAKRPDDRRPIASLTKIMTAMVVMERTQPTDMVRVSKLAERQEPTKLGLRRGQHMDVHDLLYALLLHSSNDVAVAFAEHVSDSVSAFDAMMTQRAIGLGLTDTWFASPSGLNDSGYSSARDVAAMTRWAYNSPTFAAIVATKSYTLDMPNGKPVRLRNLNDLLFDYPGAIGVKTGYTSRSHWSLVGVAKRGGTRIMVVLLGDRSKPFRDGSRLLDWGFRVAGSTAPVTSNAGLPSQPVVDLRQQEHVG